MSNRLSKRLSKKVRALISVAGAAMVFLTLSAAANRANAYACVFGCEGWCESPIPYSLQNASDDLGEELTVSELQAAMGAWANVSCTSLKTQYQGRTDQEPSGGNAIISWINTGWSNNNNGTIGTTSMTYNGCMTASMVLNGTHFKWVTKDDTDGNEVNTFTIVGHEGGHYFGLGHSSASGAIMRASYGGGKIPLSKDDEEGICAIYAGEGGGTEPPTDCTSGGCDDGYTCVNGKCEAMGGTAGNGGESGSTGTAGNAGNAGSNGTGGTGASNGAGGQGGSGSTSKGDYPAGESCEVDGDCASGFCIEDEPRAPVCRDACTGDSQCGKNGQCEFVGNEGFCEPPGPRAVEGGCAVGGNSGGLSVTGFLSLGALGLLAFVRQRGRRRQ